MLSQLEALAYRLNIDVRYELFAQEIEESKGGLLRLNDRYLIILNKRLPLKEQVDTLLKAIARFDIQGHYVRPALRELLEKAK